MSGKSGRSGGARPNSGPKKKDSVVYQFKIPRELAQRLREAIPSGQRSRFVSEAIKYCLAVQKDGKGLLYHNY